MIDQSRLSGGFVKKCGYKSKAGVLRKWYLNYDDVDRLKTKLSHKLTCIEELVLKDGAKIYPVYATKRAASNHNLVKSEGKDLYKHEDTLVILHRNPSSRERIQELVNDGRICVIIERVDRESRFEFLGFDSGMVITSDDYNTHDNNASSTISIATPDNEEELTAIKLLNIEQMWINEHLPIHEFTNEFTQEFT